MKKQKIQAFTLIELIVVITILAILGTIAFLAMQGYSSSARNSKRISDINNIKTSLALFNTRTGRYPEPDNISNVVYSGAIVWSQGEVGEIVTRNLKELGKTPLDPLLETPYVYSLLNTKKEYEIGSIFEGGTLTYNNKLLTETYAATKNYYAYIKGDYNGKVAKVSTGSNLYVFAIPSIIGANLGDPNIEELIKNKLFVYNGYQNIPSNYEGQNITMTGGFDFGGININPIIYSGSIEDLSQNYESLKTFGTNLQLAYSGTILENESSYNNIILMNIEDSDSLQQIAGNIVKNELGGEIAPFIKCATNPGYTNTNYIVGNIKIDGTPWQNSNPGDPCYYECTNGYTGNDCSLTITCATQPNYTNTNYIAGNPTENNQARQNSNPGNPCYYECKTSYTWTGDRCELSCQDGSTSPFLCADAYGSDRFQMSPDNNRVQDKLTGLSWMKSWEGGLDHDKTRSEQNSYCISGGLRLPTIMEFISILDYNNNNGYIDDDYFNSLGTSYWSSTSAAGYKILISGGWQTRIVNPVNQYYMRCVQGTWLGSQSYTDNGNGTISDNVTGLLVQQDGITQGTKRWADAVTYCSNLELGGISDWRLPNIKELTALVDYNRNNPSINTTYFSSASNLYWSSTSSSNNDYAYVINFKKEINTYDISYDAKTSYRYVRCVH